MARCSLSKLFIFKEQTETTKKKLPLLFVYKFSFALHHHKRWAHAAISYWLSNFRFGTSRQQINLRSLRELKCFSFIFSLVSLLFFFGFAIIETHFAKQKCIKTRIGFTFDTLRSACACTRRNDTNAIYSFRIICIYKFVSNPSPSHYCLSCSVLWLPSRRRTRFNWH